MITKIGNECVYQSDEVKERTDKRCFMELSGGVVQLPQIGVGLAERKCSQL